MSKLDRLLGSNGIIDAFPCLFVLLLEKTYV